MTAGSITAIYSNEDIIFYLNPQITFFKVVYRKYTNFVISEHIHRNPNNSDVIYFNAKLYGNFLMNISLIFNQSTTNPLEILQDHPLNFYDNFDLKIQNTTPIETLPVPYMKTYFRLKYANKHGMFYNFNSSGVLECNTGNIFQKMSLCGGCMPPPPSLPIFNIEYPLRQISAIIPLPFSFSKDVGRSIPVFLIDSKNGYDSSLTLKPSSINTAVNIKTDLLFKVATITEEEKRRFKTTSIEYLVEKIYYANISTLTNLYDVSERLQNECMKEIYIENNVSDYYNYVYNLFISGISILNQDKDAINHSYFSKIKIYECFPGFNIEIDPDDQNKTIIKDNIAYIPIALDNKSSAPTGTINTSSNKVHLSFKNTKTPNEVTNINLYITYYSILKIEDGIVSLLYNNN